MNLPGPLRIGDTIETNIDGYSARTNLKFEGVVGYIEDDCAFILNNEHDGTQYDNWRQDAQRYGKKYCWQICTEITDSKAYIKIINATDCLMEFFLRNKPTPVTK